MCRALDAKPRMPRDKNHEADNHFSIRCEMRTLKSVYWIVTGLMAVFMLMASIPDIMQIPQAVAIFMHLGYPAYLLPFLGTAKLLSVVVVMLPGVRSLKEWAYAGIVIDLVGALYSHLAVGDPASAWAMPLVGLLLVGGSYFCYRGEFELWRVRSSDWTRPGHGVSRA